MILFKMIIVKNSIRTNITKVKVIRMEINEEKRKKFMENAGKRVNNVMHDIQILEPMARSSVYDFTKQDVEEMFTAMQETLNNAKDEFYKKFEEKARSERKVFSFGGNVITNESNVDNEINLEKQVAPVVAEGIDVQNTENNIFESEINYTGATEETQADNIF